MSVKRQVYIQRHAFANLFVHQGKAREGIQNLGSQRSVIHRENAMQPVFHVRGHLDDRLRGWDTLFDGAIFARFVLHFQKR